MQPVEQAEGDRSGRLVGIGHGWVRQAWPLLGSLVLVGGFWSIVATARPELDPDSWGYTYIVLFPLPIFVFMLAGVIKFIRYCGHPNWREVWLGLVSNGLFFAVLVGYFLVVCIQLISSWLYP